MIILVSQDIDSRNAKTCYKVLERYWNSRKNIVRFYVKKLDINISKLTFKFLYFSEIRYYHV